MDAITEHLGRLHEDCMRCDKPLTPVFGDNQPWDSDQMDNALRVHIQGGYGMYADWLEPWPEDEPTPTDGVPLVNGHKTFLICHDCATELLQEFFKVPTSDPVFQDMHPCDGPCIYGWKQS